MRILLAEDDSLLADGLACCLRQSGFRVDRVADGQAAADVLRHEEFDLLILDIVPPWRSGAGILKGVRARKPHLPVLAISVLDSIADRVRGLDLGADDYLPKPFDLDEFAARVRVLTRRHHAGAAPLCGLGPLTIDPVGSVARLDGRVLALAPREFALLEIFIENSGRWIRNAQFVEILAERGEDISKNAVEVNIHRLRRRLGEHPVKVITSRGLGYRLVESPERPRDHVMPGPVSVRKARIRSPI